MIHDPLIAKLARRRDLDATRATRPLTPAEQAEYDRLDLALYHAARRIDHQMISAQRRIATLNARRAAMGLA